MTTITIKRNAVVKNGKFEIEVPELKEGFKGKLTLLVEEESQNINKPYSWIDLAEKISQSGVMNDLPKDYSISHKKIKVIE